ncbi:MAG: DUF3084 domain-containing protein [Candidatus Muiribacteriota bacterium]
MSEGFVKLFGIVLFSGLIAYIGDLVGFRMGKKKISFLGLRPRQTATLITIGFGIIITLITMFFAMIISEDVRVALFHMDEIKTEIRQLSEYNEELSQEQEEAIDTIKDLNEDIIDKKREINQLREFYRELRQNVIIFEVNETISFEIINPNTPKEKIEEQINNLFKKSYAKIQEAGLKTRNLEDFFNEYQKEIEEKARVMENSSNRFFLKTVASSNLTLKSKVNEFDMIAVSEIQILEAGTTLVSPFFIEGSWDKEAVYNAVNMFFDYVEEFLVKNNAMINSDYFVHPVEVYHITELIQEYGDRVYLQAKFSNDVYSLGPFNFNIEFLSSQGKSKTSSRTHILGPNE